MGKLYYMLMVELMIIMFTRVVLCQFKFGVILHLYIITSNQTCKIYLNGVLNASSSNYNISDIPSGFQEETIFGTNFKGYLDDIKSLCNSIIRQRYQRPL